MSECSTSELSPAPQEEMCVHKLPYLPSSPSLSPVDINTNYHTLWAIDTHTASPHQEMCTQTTVPSVFAFSISCGHKYKLSYSLGYRHTHCFTTSRNVYTNYRTFRLRLLDLLFALAPRGPLLLLEQHLDAVRLVPLAVLHVALVRAEARVRRGHTLLGLVQLTAQLGEVVDLLVVRSASKERRVLFNDALKTFYLRLYWVRHIIKEGRKEGRKGFI